MQYFIVKEYLKDGLFYDTEYVVYSYDHVSEHTGGKVGVKRLKATKTKKSAFKYLRRKNIDLRKVEVIE